ncbi:YfiT family bacillithiol transferase [Pontibacter vulgaris]|uniref:YfiT family bacillithiol transferase n=1 Tax=Pontibacter vulgaris TaxID=2905679 RepID=UPI001FA7FD39|nr:bacillithiol transferase BstA [Pontibacter vulgaris]
MKDQTPDSLRYPIGHHNAAQVIDDEKLSQHIHAIAELPTLLRDAVDGLTKEQLDTPYRPGGWTVRQVIHHLPDSHLNGYTRQKLALTEDKPTIRTYDEVAWAELHDGKFGAPEFSLMLLDALHKRWVLLLLSLTPEQLERKFIHPLTGEFTIRQHIGLYAWHGAHHLAHITELKKRMGW